MNPLDSQPVSKGNVRPSDIKLTLKNLRCPSSSGKELDSDLTQEESNPTKIRSLDSRWIEKLREFKDAKKDPLGKLIDRANELVHFAETEFPNDPQIVAQSYTLLGVSLMRGGKSADAFDRLSDARTLYLTNLDSSAEKLVPKFFLEQISRLAIETPYLDASLLRGLRTLATQYHQIDRDFSAAIGLLEEIVDAENLIGLALTDLRRFSLANRFISSALVHDRLTQSLPDEIRATLFFSLGLGLEASGFPVASYTAAKISQKILLDKECVVDSDIIASSYSLIGRLSLASEDPASALEALLEGSKHYSLYRDKNGAPHCDEPNHKIVLGITYATLEQVNHATKMMREAIQLSREANRHDEITLLSDYGAVHDFFVKSGEIESAQYYAKQAVRLISSNPIEGEIEDQGSILLERARAHYRLAEVLLLEFRPKSALKELRKVSRLLDQSKLADRIDIHQLSTGLVKCSILLKEYDRGLDVGLAAVEHARRNFGERSEECLSLCSLVFKLSIEAHDIKKAMAYSIAPFQLIYGVGKDHKLFPWKVETIVNVAQAISIQERDPSESFDNARQLYRKAIREGLKDRERSSVPLAKAYLGLGRLIIERMGDGVPSASLQDGIRCIRSAMGYSSSANDIVLNLRSQQSLVSALRLAGKESEEELSHLITNLENQLGWLETTAPHILRALKMRWD